jgi:quinoprotein glucose dehydrogenase
MVHHGLWDYDVPCAAILCDITVDGKKIKALAQPTKQAFLYVLNRETGKPVWPIVEKKVPKGDVPGEWYSPTQPFPTKPPAYDVQGFGPDKIIDFTPELHAEGLRLIKNYKYGPMFTPATLATPDGTWGTLTLPNLTGGSNWPGGCYDPESQTVYVYSQTLADVMMEIPNSDTNRSEFDYVNVRSIQANRDGFRAGNLTVQGLPLAKPPYGRITAIDMSKGAFRWQVAHGETPDEVKNHPALKGLTIPRTGQSSYLIGPMVTKTLVICGEPLFTTTSTGKRGAMLRAYDKATGEEKGAVYMPAPSSGVPMTYMVNGQQFVIVAVGGGGYSGELIAYRLPNA